VRRVSCPVVVGSPRARLERDARAVGAGKFAGEHLYLMIY
jgi:hypothetical protein